MRLKQGLTLEIVREKLSKVLSSHITVQISNNPFYRNIRWIEVNRDAFVGVKIFLKEDHLLIDGHIPNFFAKALVGGIISQLVHRSARTDFKNQISKYLMDEFYDK